MAPEDPPSGQARSAPRSVNLERSERVRRACGPVPAGGGVAGRRPLVRPDGPAQDRCGSGHRDRCAVTGRPSARRRPAAPVRPSRARPGSSIASSSVLHTASVPPGRSHRPGTRRDAARTWLPRAALAGVAGSDCGPPRHPLCARRRMRRSEELRQQPDTTLPSAAPSAPGDRSGAARRRWPGPGWSGSGRQTVASLAPASSEDGPTGPRRHAMAESVPLGATAVVGLVRTLHVGPPERAQVATRLAGRPVGSTRAATAGRSRDGPSPYCRACSMWLPFPTPQQVLGPALPQRPPQYPAPRKAARPQLWTMLWTTDFGRRPGGWAAER